MGFKNYNKAFSAISNLTTSQDVIQVNEDFELRAIAFSKFSNNSSNDIYFGLAVNDKYISDSSEMHLQTLKQDSGNIFELPAPILIPAKTTVTLRVKNGTGADLTIEVGLHGVV